MATPTEVSPAGAINAEVSVGCILVTTALAESHAHIPLRYSKLATYPSARAVRAHSDAKTLPQGARGPPQTGRRLTKSTERAWPETVAEDTGLQFTHR